MFERVMGLNVVDEVIYTKYRESMTPILNSYNADFGYDFIVSNVLKSKTSERINRVFTISFPSKSIMKQIHNKNKNCHSLRSFGRADSARPF